jgi:putative addiction module component (TIGR02574 family)
VIARSFSREIRAQAVRGRDRSGEIVLKPFDSRDNVSVVSASIQELRQLPIPERIQLVKELWDSIAEESPAIDLSLEQIAELDRRLDALEAQPESGTPWHIARERILASL